jgi:hypothetical protein
MSLRKMFQLIHINTILSESFPSKGPDQNWIPPSIFGTVGTFEEIYQKEGFYL